MKNPTVAQLIEHLKTLDQDAIVCNIIDWDDQGNNTYSAIETVNYYGEQVYNNNNGEDEKGKVVGIY